MRTKRAIVPLAHETRPVVDTAAVAYYLDLKPQSLRNLAAKGTAPIAPVRVCGRLRWRTDDVRALLGVTPTT